MSRKRERNGMNKFDALNKVMVSDLTPEDKCLMVELILRADDEWVSWPSVERLCKVRGIKHEKNFKGADHYLPGLVTKSKRGRKNVYRINTPALEGVSEAKVRLYHTKPKANTPAVEGVNTPAVADNTPAVEGANTSIDTSKDNSQSATAGAVPEVDLLNLREEVEVSGVTYVLSTDGVTRSPNSTSHQDPPATEGVSHEYDSRTGMDWLNIKKVRPLTAEENDYLNAKACAYNAARRTERPKLEGEW